ncbi:MAG: hypothetical protein Q8L60_08625 [Gammaproteobacteria bacterium]|nr:hypothetical protein [Gammaproteobacteria bacterium]MDP2140236.1 hypothetical protein [Gammaproteobacteria bacterium]MDP2348111.1 hypothetical protein [Gammaproteobacteria bacterium]
MTTDRSAITPALTRPLLALLILVPVVAVLLAVQLKPSVPAGHTLNSIDIHTIEQLIVNNAPEQISAAGELTLHLDKDELNLLATFALQTVPGLSEMAAAVDLSDGSATVDLAIPLPTPVYTFYLNLRTQLRQSDELLELYGVRAGYLPIPTRLVRSAISAAQERMASSYVNYQEFSDLQQSVRQIAFAEDALLITLDWEPRLITRVQAQAEQLFLSEADKNRILGYYHQIGNIVAALPEDANTISLNELMFPLFGTASARVISGADAISENRTLLQALSLYVNEADISQLAGNDSPLSNTPARRLTVTIQSRTDLAQHFTTSAAITASAGAGLAGILSNSKEAHDARYRSGFSFSDITANIAGVALGNAATGNSAEANALQRRLAAASLETDYMPWVKMDYAGTMMEDDFSQQYQDRTSEIYLDRIAEIDKEIAALPIYNGIQ